MAEESKPQIVHAYLPAEEKYTTTLTAGKHEMLSDEPESVEGGKDKGPNPYDYLLMALGSCTVMTIKMYAEHKGWELDDIYMELKHNKKHSDDCDNCEKPESKIDVIEKELIIEGDFSDKQLDRMLDISKKCPVHRTLEGDITIKSSISRK